MGRLVVPNLQGKQMGQVIATITVTNRIDQVLAERVSSLRRFVLVPWITSWSMGATVLCLLAISQLCLVQGSQCRNNSWD